MKKTMLILLLISANLSFAKSAKPKDTREIWTFTYHEYGLLQDEQKEKFIKDFVAYSKESMFLNQLSELKSKETIKDALSSEKDWSRIEEKVNKYCKDRSHSTDCEKIAATRDQVLMEFRAHK